MVLEDAPLLDKEVRARRSAGGQAGLGADELDEVRPQAAAVEHAPDGPQVGAQGRIGLQRAAERLDGARLVVELALAELAQLVGEGGDALLRCGGGGGAGRRGCSGCRVGRFVDRRGKLEREGLGARLARPLLDLRDQSIQRGRALERAGQRIGRARWRLAGLGRRRAGLVGGAELGRDAGLGRGGGRRDLEGAGGGRPRARRRGRRRGRRAGDGARARRSRRDRPVGVPVRLGSLRLGGERGEIVAILDQLDVLDLDRLGGFFLELGQRGPVEHRGAVGRVRRSIVRRSIAAVGVRAGGRARVVLGVRDGAGCRGRGRVAPVVGIGPGWLRRRACAHVRTVCLRAACLRARVLIRPRLFFRPRSVARPRLVRTAVGVGRAAIRITVGARALRLGRALAGPGAAASPPDLARRRPAGPPLSPRQRGGARLRSGPARRRARLRLFASGIRRRAGVVLRGILRLHRRAGRRACRFTVVVVHVQIDVDALDRLAVVVVVRPARASARLAQTGR